MSTITREFTKEQLIEHLKKQMKQRELHIASPATDRGFREYLELEIATNEIALASLEAEPVSINDDMAFAFHHALSDSSLGADDVEEIKTGLRAAFSNITAPPAPVSMPDELTREEYKRRFMEEDNFDDTFRGGWKACRTAILQGAEPVTTAYKLPEGWVACSERMPNIGVPVITAAGDVVQYAAYAWDGKEWQDWYEEYDKLPANTFTHWHPRPAAPQQEMK